MGSPDTKMNMPEQKSPEFKEGDRVRLTEKKIKELTEGGFIAGFPSTEGAVSAAFDYSDIITVDFGGAVRRVNKDEVEKI